MSDHTPWHVFEAQGPIPTHAAKDLAINFESRQIYKDDFRWIVDSLIAATARVAEVERDLEEYRLRLAGALTVLDGYPFDPEEPGVMPAIAGCPTIRTALRIRKERDAALARVGVLEAALRDIELPARALVAWIEQADDDGMLLCDFPGPARALAAALAPRSERREGEPLPLIPMCSNPSLPLICTRAKGHDGPCTSPLGPDVLWTPPAAPKEEAT